MSRMYGSHVALFQTIDAARANGAIVRVEPDAFRKIVGRAAAITPEPLVVVAVGTSWFTTVYSYLTHYKGLCFYTRSAMELSFSVPVETCRAGKIWIPQL